MCVWVGVGVGVCFHSVNSTDLSKYFCWQDLNPQSSDTWQIRPQDHGDELVFIYLVVRFRSNVPTSSKTVLSLSASLIGLTFLKI